MRWLSGFGRNMEWVVEFEEILRGFACFIGAKRIDITAIVIKEVKKQDLAACQKVSI